MSSKLYYSVAKYSGGTWCGLAEGFESLDEAMEFADDGFCDYARIVKFMTDGTKQTLKIHFEPSERDDDYYKKGNY